MKKLFVSSLCLFSAFLYAGSAAKIDGVAAYVNDHVITISDVLLGSREIQAALSGRSRRPSNETLNALYRESLDSLIDSKLVIDEYQKQDKIQIPESMVDERVETITHEVFQDDRAALLAGLGADGLDLATWRDQIRDNITIRAMRSVLIESKVSVSPTEVRCAYEEYSRTNTVPIRIRLRMMEIKLQDGEEDAAWSNRVQDVQKRLAAGEAFDAVTRDCSQDRFAEKGGLRDWAAADMYRSELAEGALQLQKGGTSEAIIIGESAFFLRLEDREEPRPVSFEDVEQKIQWQLRRQKSNKRYEAWLESLRRDAYIKILAEKQF